ncbi:hypothetical protein Ae168Ps1_0453 [Pseudonocardia sp. Ae168_Ps1]|nr:hypothetical protein Ae150APs1_0459 [Pseudonocardia sp. Ae150A_Ps1]OLL78047.1 hypothetical protein Ae168Ps1_0453 [Pseudonocardia sp. Ae168_Ps1]OLL87828.1 hypothetical protein Ae263Ps1_4883c [Pseudonocardia sp. Ae263_Ps1]OLL92146.1 hypothetical protein Ae356Ps1_2043 [Pseudonocardia sp. Ae356_Ps1]
MHPVRDGWVLTRCSPGRSPRRPPRHPAAGPPGVRSPRVAERGRPVTFRR